MALARLALRNLRQRVSSSSASSSFASLQTVSERSADNINTLVGVGGGGGGCVQRQKWSRELLKRFMATASSSDEKKQGNEVAVTEKKSRLFPRRRRRGRRSLWRNNDDFPHLYDFFPTRLGDALMQATDNINRLFENLNVPTPSQLMGRVKEKDDCYKLRLEVPGLGKDEVKITIEDGVLRIKGEHKEEKEARPHGGDDDEEEEEEEWWSSRSYGYYDTTLVLPDDAKVDEIKAELKDGVLNVIVPKTEKAKKDVKVIQID